MLFTSPGGIRFVWVKGKDDSYQTNGRYDRTRKNNKAQQKKNDRGTLMLVKDMLERQIRRKRRKSRKIKQKRKEEWVRVNGGISLKKEETTTIQKEERDGLWKGVPR